MRFPRRTPARLLLASLCLLAAPPLLEAAPYEGYTLFGPNNGNTAYLTDMDNVTVKTWTSSRNGAYSTYLLDDGSILRSAASNNSNLNGGGATGIVQRIGPSNNLLWEYWYSNNQIRSHHDIEPMPSGNVLLIAWERKTAAEAVQAGLDHSAEIWPDHIVEVQPVGSTGGNIVWEWHAWDHLIQDWDPSKDNYGIVGDHPELLDINLGGGGLGGGDWMHTNGISYDPAKDQIVISSHTLNEIWVIDHSTTTAEAAGHSGGNAGRGGDFLYRWGCPSNYDAPGGQYFDVVHCSIWVPAGYPGAGHILAFNNRDGQGTSVVCEINPPYNGQYNYSLTPGQAYLPATPYWTFTAAWFYSVHLGSCQRLPNGNTFIDEATSGYMFEVNSGGNLEWSYNRGGEIAMAFRYGDTHPGIVALGLANGVGDAGPALGLRLLPNRPNPFADRTTLRYRLLDEGPVTIQVFDASGRLRRTVVDRVAAPGEHQADFDGTGLPAGTYLCRLRAEGREESIALTVVR